MPESPDVQDVRGISVPSATAERDGVFVPMAHKRMVVPFIEKRWKKAWMAAKREAERQARAAYPGLEVAATGRTFHDSTDWGFEFEVTERRDI